MDYIDKIFNAIHFLFGEYKNEMGEKVVINYDQKTKMAIVCFFKCVTDLIPNGYYRKIFENFNYQYSIENNIQTNHSVFEWTVKLNNFFNHILKRNKITFEDAIEKYTIKRISDWANPMWFIIHFFAINSSYKLSNSEKETYTAFIGSLSYLIPCPQCRHHMSEYISSEENDIRKNIETNDQLFVWTWKFHNSVSKRTGKKQLDLKEAYNMYKLQPENTLIDF